MQTFWLHPNQFLMISQKFTRTGCLEKNMLKKENKETPKNKVAVNDTINKADKKPKVIDFVPVTFPNKAYGNKSIPQSENMIIRNATVWTNEKRGILQNTDVAVSNGLIVAIGQNLENKNGQKKSMELTNI